jgi:predicted RNA-binding Zn-ribbon protein involved in translation (DUF1610 family)
MNTDTVYCLRCRRPISVALSDSGAGYCPECGDIRNREASARNAPLFDAPINTGKGICPACGSRDIKDYNAAPNTIVSQICVAGCGGVTILVPGCMISAAVNSGFDLGLGIAAIIGLVSAAWLIILLAIGHMLGKKDMHRRCGSCGHSWPI